MGVYLSSPITDKESIDGQCDRFVYGASSMQGWRITQEDAHNCIPLFDEKTNTSFFAVYDGHGGSEVAKYCERHFPEFMKKLIEAEGETEDPSSVIKNAFLEFDGTLTNDDVIKELKELAGKDDDNEEDDDCDPVGRSEAELLKEEANMPLDQLLAQYKGMTPDRIKNSHDSSFQSPALRAKSELTDDENLSQDAENGPSSSVCTSSSGTTSSSPSKLHKPNSSSECSNGEEGVNKSNQNNQPQTTNLLDTATDSSSSHTNCNNDNKNTTSSTPPSAVSGESPSSASNTKNEGADSCSNSESAACIKQTETCDSSLPSELPEPAGSAKAASSSQDSDDGPSGSGTSAKACSKSNKANTTEDVATIDGDMDTSDDEDEEDLWEDMSDDDEDDDDEEDEADEDVPMMNMSDEEPGSDSGCTACVVLMQGKKLFVANAGDSRCVLSRAGSALELSFDHKPEDELEKERIENAGGKVTADGRVNGGLNLSRAIGDHVYKRNRDLPAEEQMITALPDIESIDLCDEDQFIVIACDGIWNYMSSQEVVDYVSEKFKDPEKRRKPSAVCEMLFDHCLAPNTAGDGTGCDNMTCIIVVLDSFLNPLAEQATPAAAHTRETVVKNAENNLEEQLTSMNERGDAGSGSLKRCADNVEVREEKRVKVEEEVV